MDESNLLHDVRYIRDVVARSQRPEINRFWPVTLSWGCVITAGYLICGLLARAGQFAPLRWIWPVLIFAVALPLNWYLVRRIRIRIEHGGVRPRFRRELALCWCGITAIGFLWTAALVASKTLISSHWYILCFIWASLYFIGYIINGVLISAEWLWAAAALLLSIIVIYLAGPAFSWLLGLWMGGTMIFAGLMGRYREHRLVAQG